MYFNVEEKLCKSKEGNAINIDFRYIILCIICLQYMIYAQVSIYIYTVYLGI